MLKRTTPNPQEARGLVLEATRTRLLELRSLVLKATWLVGASVAGAEGHAVSAAVTWMVGAGYNAAGAGGHVDNAAVLWLRPTSSAVICAMKGDGT